MKTKQLPIGVIYGEDFKGDKSKAVQKLAIEYGWDERKSIMDETHDEFYEATDEASTYLTQFAPKGYIADFFEGMWGVWEEELFDI